MPGAAMPRPALPRLLSWLLLLLLPASGEDTWGQPDPELVRKHSIYNVDTFAAHSGELHREMARMSAQLNCISREAAAGGAAVDASRIAACKKAVAPEEERKSPAHHGRTMFVTMCSGAQYFEIYCGPFLASFEAAYGTAAAMHRVVMFHTSVNPAVLEAAEERFAPWLQLVPLPDDGTERSMDELNTDDMGGLNSQEVMVCRQGDAGRLCEATISGQKKREMKTMMDSFWFPIHVAGYVEKHGQGFCYLVLMDSDVLFVRPLGQYLPDCSPQPAEGLPAGAPAAEQVDWDVAFTVYTPDFKTPWAKSAEDVGRTKGGHVRINCGVSLMNLRDPALIGRFLRHWARASGLMLKAPEDDCKMIDDECQLWQGWYDQLYDEFRGNDQSALALLLTGYDTTLLPSLLGWGSCRVCEGSVEARVDMSAGLEPTPIRFRALKARSLNHPESMEGGKFQDDLCIVHLKGLWWRMALSKSAGLYTPTRRQSWNKDALLLHIKTSTHWHEALRLFSPDLIMHEHMQVRSNTGANITEEFMELQAKSGATLRAAMAQKEHVNPAPPSPQ